MGDAGHHALGSVSVTVVSAVQLLASVTVKVCEPPLAVKSPVPV